MERRTKRKAEEETEVFWLEDFFFFFPWEQKTSSAKRFSRGSSPERGLQGWLERKQTKKKRRESDRGKGRFEEVARELLASLAFKEENE